MIPRVWLEERLNCFLYAKGNRVACSRNADRLEYATVPGDFCYNTDASTVLEKHDFQGRELIPEGELDTRTYRSRPC